MTQDRQKDGETFLTRKDVLDAHAEHGRLDYTDKPSPSGSVEGLTKRVEDWIVNLILGHDEQVIGTIREKAKAIVTPLAEALKGLEQEVAKRNAYIADLVTECNHFSEKSDRLAEAIKSLLGDTDTGMMFSDRITKARAALQGRG